GDVNGDGYDDVIIGSPGFTNTSAEEGRAYLFYGTNSVQGLSSQPAWTVDGGSGFAWLGTWVAGVGDVNGDGYGDVLIGAPGIATVFCYLGGAHGLSATPAWKVGGTTEDFEVLAWGGAKAGDVNGDGYDDVALQGELQGLPGRRVFVYFGGPNGLSAGNAWMIGSEYASVSVASAGDVNDDGYGDLIVGEASLAESDPPVPGKASVYLGGPLGLSSNPTWISEGRTFFGISVSSGGDTDGDGFGDLVVGSPMYASQPFSGLSGFTVFNGPLESKNFTGWVRGGPGGGAWLRDHGRTKDISNLLPVPLLKSADGCSNVVRVKLVYDPIAKRDRVVVDYS
ncbi:MAG: FG-GAP-like repeat-containing protein, partial [Verrucomicrobiales bacterium]